MTSVTKRTLWAALYILSASCTAAQTLRHSIAMPYTALGAYSIRHTDVFAFGGNQAALAQQHQPTAGAYAERRFMLAAATAYRAMAALPTRLGHFGLQVDYMGFGNFAEQGFGLAYARSLGKKVDLGIQFGHYGYRVPGQGNAAAIGVGAGALLHFSDRLHGGIQVQNPLSARLSKANGEKLAATYKWGLGYEASDRFFVAAEMVKEEGRAVSVTAGAQYRLLGQFFARAGFVSGTSTMFGGAGVGWQNLRLEVAASYHPQLGLSPGLLFIFFFKKNK
jgi:hypothetical protein